MMSGAFLGKVQRAPDKKAVPRRRARRHNRTPACDFLAPLQSFSKVVEHGPTLRHPRTLRLVGSVGPAASNRIAFRRRGYKLLQKCATSSDHATQAFAALISLQALLIPTWNNDLWPFECSLSSFNGDPEGR